MKHFYIIITNLKHIFFEGITVKYLVHDVKVLIQLYFFYCMVYKFSIISDCVTTTDQQYAQRRYDIIINSFGFLKLFYIQTNLLT